MTPSLLHLVCFSAQLECGQVRLNNQDHKSVYKKEESTGCSSSLIECA